MFGEHHHLAEEMPEYKDKIHELKMNNEHFAKLYDEYVDKDKAVYRAEEGIETPSDEVVETLKKERLLLKDQLIDILKSA